MCTFIHPIQRLDLIPNWVPVIFIHLDPMSMHKLNSFGNRKVGEAHSICITTTTRRTLIIVYKRNEETNKSNAFFFMKRGGFQTVAHSWSCSKTLG
jgi:hypothetical protein